MLEPGRAVAIEIRLRDLADAVERTRRLDQVVNKHADGLAVVDLMAMVGRRTEDLPDGVGPEVIHCDDLVMLPTS